MRIMLDDEIKAILDKERIKKFKNEQKLYRGDKNDVYTVEYSETPEEKNHFENILNIYKVSQNESELVYQYKESGFRDMKPYKESGFRDMKPFIVEKLYDEQGVTICNQGRLYYVYNDDKSIIYSEDSIQYKKDGEGSPLWFIRSADEFTDVERSIVYDLATEELFMNIGGDSFAPLDLSKDLQAQVIRIFRDTTNPKGNLQALKNISYARDKRYIPVVKHILEFYKLLKAFNDDLLRIKSNIYKFNSLRTLDEINGRSRKKTKND